MPYLCNNYKIRCTHFTTAKRNYSNSFLPFLSFNSSLVLSVPVPIKIIHKLDDNNLILSYGEQLSNKTGIYCFVNTINKRYIRSGKNLYLRLV